MKNNLQEQPEKVQKLIIHDLHHDISYSTDNEVASSINESLRSPLLSEESVGANTEFNSINNYFTDESEDPVLQNRRSSVDQRRLSNGTPVFQTNMTEDQERRDKLKKQYKHEIHQKVRWYKLLFQVANILKWCIFLML